MHPSGRPLATAKIHGARPSRAAGPDDRLTFRGHRLLWRLAAHQEVEGELVWRVPDRQPVRIGPGLQGRVGMRLELDPGICRWLAHTGTLAPAGRAARAGAHPRW